LQKLHSLSLRKIFLSRAALYCVGYGFVELVLRWVPVPAGFVELWHIALDSIVAAGFVWLAFRVPAWFSEKELDLPAGIRPHTFTERIVAGARSMLRRWRSHTIPVYDGEGYYVGALPKSVVRPRQLLRAALFWQSPYRYRLMLEHLPIGQAHCKLAEMLTTGRDFVVLDANSACLQAFDGWPSPLGGRASERWPMLLRDHPAFFEQLATMAPDGTPIVYGAWFASLGKSLELRAVNMGDDHFSLTVTDVTDDRQYRAEVLRLHEQMSNRMAALDENVYALSQTTDSFVQRAVENLHETLEAFDVVTADPDISDDASHTAAHGMARVQQTVHAMVRFSQVTALDYTPALVPTDTVIGELLALSAERYPHIEFRKGPLPQTTASAPVLEAVMRGLMETVCTYAAQDAGTTVEVGVRSEMLDTVYYVSARDVQPMELVPAEADDMTFPEVAAALQLTVCRRLAQFHGGSMRLEQHGYNLEFTLTLGSPLKRWGSDTPLANPR